MLLSRSCVIAVLCTLCLADAALNTKFKASVPVKQAAVAAIAPNYPHSNGPALLVSTFGVVLYGGSPSFAIPSVKDVMAGNATTPQQIEKSEVWTNWIDMAPESVAKNTVLTAGGFLVPIGPISTGKIALFDVTDPSKPIRTQISTDKKGWFYHKVVWHDMNGDGRLDLVAARATAPSPIAGEMVWFEQPTDGAVSNATFTAEPWKEHVTTDEKGPDVDFIFEDLDGDGKPEMVATQFFSAQQLAIYSCPEASWTKCDKSNVVRTIIDDVNGPFFAIQRVDLNGDGKKDLLVTNNQDDKGKDGKGSVFAYEQPANGFTGTWSKHVLATGYVPIASLFPSPGAHSKGSPGRSIAFQAKTGATGKPQILVSGDDGGFVSVLTATSEEAGSWDYSQKYLCNSTGTIGSPTVGDVDGDGFADIFVPFYADNKIEMYTFEEAGEPFSPSEKCVACLLKKDPVHLSPAYTWCYKDNQCHVVGSPTNPCDAVQCASAASTSKCKCTSCNDPACGAA